MEAPARASRLQALLLAAFALLTAAAILGTSLVSLYVAIEARADIKEDIREIHILMNSRLDELLVEARKNARAEGVIEGEKR